MRGAPRRACSRSALRALGYPSAGLQPARCANIELRPLAGRRGAARAFAVRERARNRESEGASWNADSAAAAESDRSFRVPSRRERLRAADAKSLQSSARVGLAGLTGVGGYTRCGCGRERKGSCAPRRGPSSAPSSQSGDETRVVDADSAAAAKSGSLFCCRRGGSVCATGSKWAAPCAYDCLDPRSRAAR